jgi:RNA polymerase sigma-70 factor (ECF subfamily)
VFPLTHKSLIERVRSSVPDERERAIETLLAAYWTPIYTYLRVAWNAQHDDAEDLTQEVFARGIPNRVLAQFDPARGRLRTYLRLCLDRFMANQHKAARRLKRGGSHRSVSIYLSDIETELAREAIRLNDDREDFFRRELARSVFGLALEELRIRYEAGGKQVQFSMFVRYDVEGGPDAPSYAQLAGEAGVSVAQVTNYLASVRRAFRQITLDVLRRLTMTNDEFREEARALLGIEVP